jgi:rhomboid protease GluP
LRSNTFQQRRTNGQLTLSIEDNPTPKLEPGRKTAKGWSMATVSCFGCGALNEDGFDACIRCGQPLGDALPAEKASRRVPAPRTRTRARMLGVGPGTEDLFGKFPADSYPATKILVLMTGLVFLAQMQAAMQRNPEPMSLLMGGHVVDIVRFGGLIPGHLSGVIAEPWRLLSATFIHFGLIHFGMNMLGLVQLGRFFEPAVGSIRTLIVYVATGIGAFGIDVLWSAIFGGSGITGGASGAIFGLMGAILGWLWRRKDPRWKSWLGQAVFYSLMFGFLINAGQSSVRINNAAHVGGLLCGVVLGALFGPGAPKPSTGWQRVLALVAILACIASMVLAQLSPLPRAIELMVMSRG